MAVAVRILVYEGSNLWIKTMLAKSYVSPTNPKVSSIGNIKELGRKIYGGGEEYDRDYSNGSSGSKSESDGSN